MSFILRAYIDREPLPYEKDKIIQGMVELAAILSGVRRDHLNIQIRRGSLEIIITVAEAALAAAGYWFFKVYFGQMGKNTADDHYNSMKENKTLALSSPTNSEESSQSNMITYEYYDKKQLESLFPSIANTIYTYNISELHITSTIGQQRGELHATLNPDGLKVKVDISNTRDDVRKQI
jgi:hypothetical protein